MRKRLRLAVLDQRALTLLEIVADGAEDVIRRLLAEDAALAELDIRRAGLADAFLELTRDTDREAA